MQRKLDERKGLAERADDVRNLLELLPVDLDRSTPLRTAAARAPIVVLPDGRTTSQDRARQQMNQRPDIAKTLGSLGCLMWLIPIVVILGALFIAIAIRGGVTGIAAAIFLVSLVAVLVDRARRKR